MKKILRLLMPLLAVVLIASCASCTEWLPSTTSSNETDGTLQVIFFDVGQADCILLKTDGRTMLIDAGNLRQDALILGYLQEHGVTKLDYLVATHPHADHIGSMAAVIRAMDSIGEIIMPNRTHTTETYKDLLNAIEEKDVPMTIPSPGDEFMFGEARVQVLAPNRASYANINDYSVVLRVEFGSKSFLFTGDADTASEREQLANGLTLKADVLKVAHHGSRDSSTQNYLNAVAPSYAVISLGAKNTYGHPHAEAMTRLNGTNAVIYRTDLNGTIIFTTDGIEITISVEKGAAD